MKRLLIILFLTAFSVSCSTERQRPVATLSYDRVEVTKSGFGFLISFTSDTDLLALFGPAIGEGVVCALEDDLDFSIGHYLTRSGRGSVNFVNDATGGHYESKVIFREVGDVQGQEVILGGTALREVLLRKEYITCVFRVRTTSNRTYVSNLMQVPVADIVNAIDTNQ
ncbi:hypothetical protein [Pseudomonas sp. TWP3-2]|uniref:hypothetical protein n=1 Tax=Pseudomonas sp. TWP3-2 TaxID=2804574 RepID=UPI003CECC021